MDPDESLDRALADLEMLKAAYPDEVTTTSDDRRHDSPLCFPLHCSFHLSQDSFVQLEFTNGYPITSGVQISKYRSSAEKGRMEAVVRAIRQASNECLAEEVEGAFACCAAALETWNEYQETTTLRKAAEIEKEESITSQETALATIPSVDWFTGEPLVDRKSSFVARACRVTSEQQVHQALQLLIDGSSKLQRATHNMYAYRLSEELPNGVLVKKFDNDDDGEDGAGKCLAHLLEMRDEDGVLVLVSRWYGGIKLGPKRFAHITNAARELLVTCHEDHWNND